MEDRLIKYIAFGGIVVMLAVTTVTYFLPKHLKSVPVISEEEVQNEITENEQNEDNYYDEDSSDEEEKVVKSCLNIPLPENVTESDINIEESYVDQMIKISINNIESDFFSKNPLKGSSDHIGDLIYGATNDGAQIELYLDSVYEYETEFANNNLSVKFIEPKSVYEKIVVIDPGHGSKAAGTVHNNVIEKEINLEIALKLKKLLDESDIKAYFTRTEDTNPSFDARAGLANNTNADFFISIHNNSDASSSKSSGTEVLYNELETPQGFGSESLAKILQEEVSGILQSRDRGLAKGNSIYIIRNSNVPVALVEVGFVTNPKEASLLQSEEYQQKAAQGIFNAIKRAYEERDNQNG